MRAEGLLHGGGRGEGLRFQALDHVVLFLDQLSQFVVIRDYGIRKAVFVTRISEFRLLPRADRALAILLDRSHQAKAALDPRRRRFSSLHRVV